MPTGSYDLITLGNEPAGLVAATLCARRGMRVLLARTGRYRPSYQLGPHTLPAAALPFTNLASPAIARVTEELHFDHALKRKLATHDPPFQLIGPDARIDVTADDVALRQELVRELGPSEDRFGALESAFARAADVAEELGGVLGADVTFPPTGFWKRREVGRSQARIEDDAAAWLEDASADELARALVSLPAAMSCRLDPEELPAEACARAIAEWRRGTARLPGDWAALEEMFLEKFDNHAGEVKEVKVAGLTWSWGRASGIELESGETFGAEHIIAAMPLSELEELASAKRPKRLSQLAAGIEPAGYRYTLNLLVAETGVPEGMARTVLYVADPAAPLAGDNALAIYVGEPDSEARVIVTVEADAPPLAEGEKLGDMLADLRIRIRERLEDVMPFVSEHILLAHSPNEAVPAEGVEGALELRTPIAPPVLWRTNAELESHLGVTAVPYDVGIKRLSVASSQVVPGLGLEGIFAAGWSAAKIASAGKKRDVAKQELLAAKR